MWHVGQKKKKDWIQQDDQSLVECIYSDTCKAILLTNAFMGILIWPYPNNHFEVFHVIHFA